MSCCNKPPAGGTPEIGPLLKVFAGLLVVVFLIAWIFG